MPPQKRPRPNAARARLDVLAAGNDERAFQSAAMEALASPQRLDREAAIAALVGRPLPVARDRLRALYAELNEDGTRRDQGCDMRAGIVKILTEIADPRDTDIAIRATETTERIFGDDVAYRLRIRGLQMLARIDPAALPFYAIEHLDDATRYEDEPAATAVRLLGATGNFAVLYQWLRGPGMTSPNLVRAFDAFSDAPPEIVRRFVAFAVDAALRQEDEALCTVLAEAIVNLEIESSYDALAAMMSARTTDELHSYLAMILARTNRPPLLAILEQQLRGGRRPKIIVEALSVRPTDEQRAILKRWENR